MRNRTLKISTSVLAAAALLTACGGGGDSASSNKKVKAADMVATSAQFIKACTKYYEKAPHTFINAYTKLEMENWPVKEIQASGPKAFCECVDANFDAAMSKAVGSVNKLATDVDLDEPSTTSRVVQRARWDGVDGYPKKLAYELSPETADRPPLMSLVNAAAGPCEQQVYDASR